MREPVELGVENHFSITLRGTRLERQRWLTLALSGEAAVASAKPTGDMIGEHHSEPGSGLVRFNALLGVACMFLAKLSSIYELPADIVFNQAKTRRREQVRLIVVFLDEQDEPLGILALALQDGPVAEGFPLAFQFLPVEARSILVAKNETSMRVIGQDGTAW